MGRALLFLMIFLLLPIQDSDAGGLFGRKGIIRGTVGKILDKNVEKPITTPLAKEATKGVTTAVGTAVGGPIGGLVGEHVGNVINERAAGQSPAIGKAARPATNQQGHVTFDVSKDMDTFDIFEPFAVRFFSQSRPVTWPGLGKSYEMNADNPKRKFSLVCQIGESVCIGAISQADGRWGAGMDGKFECANCCSRCEPPGVNSENKVAFGGHSLTTRPIWPSTSDPRYAEILKRANEQIQRYETQRGTVAE